MTLSYKIFNKLSLTMFPRTSRKLLLRSQRKYKQQSLKMKEIWLSQLSSSPKFNSNKKSQLNYNKNFRKTTGNNRLTEEK